jgi:hypothetical protein
LPLSCRVTVRPVAVVCRLSPLLCRPSKSSCRVLVPPVAVVVPRRRAACRPAAPCRRRADRQSRCAACRPAAPCRCRAASPCSPSPLCAARRRCCAPVKVAVLRSMYNIVYNMVHCLPLVDGRFT